MNFKMPAAAILTLLVLTALTSYWGARAGSAAGYYTNVHIYNPRFFVQTGFNTPGQGYEQPIGSGWPPNASVEVLVIAEPIRGDDGAFAGTTSTWRSVAIYTTDSWGSFGYIPPTQYPVAGNICGVPPQGLAKPLFLAKNTANQLLEFVSGENSIYFTYAACPKK